MTELDIRRPWLQTRVWDRDYNLLYDSDTGETPFLEWLRDNLVDDWLPVTLDQEKIRWHGRVSMTVSNQIQFKHDYEQLDTTFQFDNPYLPKPEEPAS